MSTRAEEFKLILAPLRYKVAVVPLTTLIATEQLAELLNLPACVVIDCRYDLGNESWGVEQYRAAHVPGAVYADLAKDLSGRPDGRNGRHPLPGHEAMCATFGRLGVSPAAQVVAYDQSTGMYASRLWWMLRYMGHDAVAVLDGGFAKWAREGRPTRAGDESRPPVAFAGRPRPEMRVSANQVWARLGDPSMTLVDARAPARYEGREEPLDRVAGHIPGARNHFYQQNLGPDGTFLPPERLREQFTALLGATPPPQVTVYCGSGVTACHDLLAMEHAGLTGVKLFPGSWSEWSSDPDRPVATGPDAPPAT
jgi:thiosulfate/3-mercaptopyruvate sulfurtransferase